MIEILFGICVLCLVVPFIEFVSEEGIFAVVATVSMFAVFIGVAWSIGAIVMSIFRAIGS